MENPPKQLTDEELTAQKAACGAFDLTPYVDRLAEVLSGSWSVNEIGGIAIDMAKAWMAVPCAHDEVFFSEIQRITELIIRLAAQLEEKIGTDKLTEIQRRIDPRYNSAEKLYRDFPPLRSMMCDFAWAWLPSYRRCYRETVHINSPALADLLDIMSVPEETKKMELRLMEVGNNCPYDPSRIDEQKFADLLFLDSLASNSDKPIDVARCAGIQLGKAVFDAYAGRNEEEYRYLVVCAGEGVRDRMMREFADSKLMRQGKITPMVLCEQLQRWAATAVVTLCRRGGQ
ncbi:MAG: hypothetical protein IIZ25_12075 [Thermoguttaceae bacterium]|nr:hypothetical protein [Thermoguttaceae bacterium]